MIPQTAQTDVRLTVYNNNLAVIRDTRKPPVSYSGEKAVIAFENVSSKLLPETCTLEGVTAIEQNFNYDLLNTTSMLEKSVGKTITLAHINPAFRTLISRFSVIFSGLKVSLTVNCRRDPQ